MSNQKNESFEKYSDDLRKNILKNGIWNSYENRIKNLLKAEAKFWELYYTESNLENKRALIGDIVNLQPVIIDWYNAAKKLIEYEADPEACK